jgi:hypothetical protein
MNPNLNTTKITRCKPKNLHRFSTQIKFNTMVFKHFNLKYSGMRKEQKFTLYPYDGGDTIKLQSSTRICSVNLRTGEGVSSKAHSNGSYFHDLYAERGAYKIQLEETIITEIQGYLWNKQGEHKQGGIIIENKPLFSVK